MTITVLSSRQRSILLPIAAVVFISLSGILLLGSHLNILSLSPTDFLIASHNAPSCSPEAYADGWWSYEPRTNITAMQDPEDTFLFSGYEDCASTRDFWWHLAVDNHAQWNRFPNVESYKWKVDPNTCQLGEFDTLSLLKSLVEKGGWLLVGDSTMEGHFFTSSCLLGPHVIATPYYHEVMTLDHASEQNLYLDPLSPLRDLLQFPIGWNINTTPLVTFKRVDLLWTPEELQDLYEDMYHPSKGFQLFGNEISFNLSPREYMGSMTDVSKHYGTMIISTGGHWTFSHFKGIEGASEDGYEDDFAVDRLKEFFETVMEKWAKTVQSVINPDQNVIIRSYLPGHENCHDFLEPWKEIQPYKNHLYNWHLIPDFNDIFQRVISRGRYANLHFLPIERPGRLRPDAHVTSDCLHLMTGSGVMEGWTEYIWHYITHELSSKSSR